MKKLDTETTKLDSQIKQRIEQEKHAKMRENQLAELRKKIEIQYSQAQELNAVKANNVALSTEMSRQIDEFSQQCSAASQIKQHSIQQIEELQRTAAEEKREKQSLNLLAKNLQHELEQQQYVF